MSAHTWCVKLSASLLKNKVNLSSVCRLQARHRRLGGLRRNTVAVLTPEDEERKLAERNTRPKLSRSSAPQKEYNNNLDIVEDLKPVKPIKHRPILESVSVKQKVKGKNETASFEFETLKEKDDSRFGPVVMCTKSRKHREKKREILLEGRRLVKDALNAKAILKTLYFSKREALEGLPIKSLKAPIYKVQERSLQLWSDLVTPPGIMGIFQMPNQGEINIERTDTIPVTLICDNVRDPGNVGTLIRVAAAVGCDQVLLTKGCVDIWEPKVLRSGAGCHFRVPLINNLDWETVLGYFPSDSCVFLADVGHAEKMVDYNSQINPEDLRLLLEQNSAGSGHGGEMSDSDTAASEYDLSEKKELDLFRRLRLPSKLYHQVDFGSGHIVIIISNESTGPSPQAKKAVFNSYGETVIVPMATNVDSLNNSVAAGVILFEIQRQLTMKAETVPGT